MLPVVIAWGDWINFVPASVRSAVESHLSRTWNSRRVTRRSAPTGLFSVTAAKWKIFYTMDGSSRIRICGTIDLSGGTH
jgi:hypothetical protein